MLLKNAGDFQSYVGKGGGGGRRWGPARMEPVAYSRHSSPSN